MDECIKIYTRGGSVVISTHTENNAAHISIKDTGIGIPAEDVKKVFERFYRSEKSRNRKYGGSGIGLTISKQLVEAHGGTIWITSDPLQGTTVFIRLPYK
ncbi:cell wall metabolism sensor histidine kinase WalK [Fictibacillus sp. KIGAM418]|uniref:histidine kinase n=1 Tax=Fictibacillus marinisediminis TaxID=2878389 RepID=A0A9X2BF73_9BACL|nr:cell wall metabolism sensor histidine kinase WalK [Fictibacillus marinisediminis]